MNKTPIEWCTHSTNPIRARHRITGRVGHHCVKVSPGCKFCYASRLQSRFGFDPFEGDAEARNVDPYLAAEELQAVLRCRTHGVRLFWCDMTDMFGEWVPDEWLDQCFAVMALTPHITHLVLTKRAKRMHDYCANPETPARWARAANKLHCERTGEARHFIVPDVAARWRSALPNVHLGVSAENPDEWRSRVALLHRTPAAVRFVSAEPLLGAIDCNDIECDHDDAYTEPDTNATICKRCENDERFRDLDLVIVGGESGPGARPCDVRWIRDVVRQCREAGTACFVKQLGSHVISDGITRGDECWPATVAKEDTLRGHWRHLLADRKGGAMEQWPLDLRVRELPA